MHYTLKCGLYTGTFNFGFPKILMGQILMYISFVIEYQTHEGRELYKLKEDHSYYDQVQGHLHICNKSACDCAELTTKDIAIVRVLLDKLWTSNITNLLICILLENFPLSNNSQHVTTILLDMNDLFPVYLSCKTHIL